MPKAINVCEATRAARMNTVDPVLVIPDDDCLNAIATASMARPTTAGGSHSRVHTANAWRPMKMNPQVLRRKRVLPGESLYVPLTPAEARRVFGQASNELEE